MHARAEARMRKGFLMNAEQAAKHDEHRSTYLTSCDVFLDEYLDGTLRATNWDADAWGLPTLEMRQPLGALLAKAGGPKALLWPREPMMRVKP